MIIQYYSMIVVMSKSFCFNKSLGYTGSYTGSYTHQNQELHPPSTKKTQKVYSVPYIGKTW